MVLAKCVFSHWPLQVSLSSSPVLFFSHKGLSYHKNVRIPLNKIIFTQFNNYCCHRNFPLWHVYCSCYCCVPFKMCVPLPRTNFFFDRKFFLMTRICIILLEGNNMCFFCMIFMFLRRDKIYSGFFAVISCQMHYNHFAWIFNVKETATQELFLPWNFCAHEGNLFLSSFFCMLFMLLKNRRLI